MELSQSEIIHVEIFDKTQSLKEVNPPDSYFSKLIGLSEIEMIAIVTYWDIDLSLNKVG